MSGGYSLNLCVDDKDFIPTKDQFISTVQLLQKHDITMIPFSSQETPNEKYQEYQTLMQRGVHKVNWDDKNSIFLMIDNPINPHLFLSIFKDIVENFDEFDDYYLSDRETTPSGTMIVSKSILEGVMGADSNNWNSRFQIIGVFIGNPRLDAEIIQRGGEKFLKIKNVFIRELESFLKKKVKFVVDWTD